MSLEKPPNPMLYFPSPFPLQYEGLPAVLLLERAVLLSCVSDQLLLRAPFTVTLYTQKNLTSVTESAKIMRLIVSNGKMINDGLERM
jgi:hypothetical protein